MVWTVRSGSGRARKWMSYGARANGITVLCTVKRSSVRLSVYVYERRARR